VQISSHDSDSLGVDGAQVGVFEQSDQISLGGFLEGQDGLGLESNVLLVFHGNVSDESLERKLSDEEVSGLLELSNFSEGDSTGSVSVGLLDTTSDLSGLSGGLGSELLTRVLDTGGFSGSLLSTSHERFEG